MIHTVSSSINTAISQVTILGSTGSVGANTIDVLQRHPERFKVYALTANTNVDLMLEQCRRLLPKLVVMADEAACNQLKEQIANEELPIKVLSGKQGLITAATQEADIVMAAIVGAVGLEPTLAAVKAGKRVLLANKEPLVMCGQLILDEAKKSGAVILPIDSEHSAIFQCMPSGYRPGLAHAGVSKLILTCSGGPFRLSTAAELASATPEQACCHPNWKMGRKISVDSATLMNKGLELIEACRLFSMKPDDIEIVIHPQSVIHSMVQYIDGSVLAHLGYPDMRTPIACALAWPDRISSGVDALNLQQLAQLEFEPPNFKQFPCLQTAIAACRQGGTAPTVVNAANEIAVESFLSGELHFLGIAELIAAVYKNMEIDFSNTFESIMAADQQARSMALSLISSSSQNAQQGLR